MTMFSILLCALLSLGTSTALPIHYQASFDTSSFHISTPDTLHQCTPALFAWTPSTGPYHLTVTTSPAHATEGDVVVIPHATSASWIVDVPEGREVTVVVIDAKGRTAESVVRTVQSGPSHCL